MLRHDYDRTVAFKILAEVREDKYFFFGTHLTQVKHKRNTLSIGKRPGLYTGLKSLSVKYYRGVHRGTGSNLYGSIAIHPIIERTRASGGTQNTDNICTIL